MEQQRETSHPDRQCYSPISQATTIVIDSEPEDNESVIVIEPESEQNNIENNVEEINTNFAVKVPNHEIIPNELLVRYIREYPFYINEV